VKIALGRFFLFVLIVKVDSICDCRYNTHIDSNKEQAMKGKYSPTVYGSRFDGPYDRNARGEMPAPWNAEVAAIGVVYDEETMFGNYDEQGFDSYGYSAYDADENYVGVGGYGVDRNGLTEFDYLTMSDEEFSTYC
jgi:hypothetical protein